MQVVKENHDNQIPADYLADAFYGLNYKQLKTALDPTAAYYNNAKLEKARKYSRVCRSALRARLSWNWKWPMLMARRGS